MQCLGLTAVALALHAVTAQPRHATCQALITLTRRSLSVSRALHVLSSCVLCLAPPAVDLLEALGRCACTRRACPMFAYIALLLLPLSVFVGVGAPSLSLAGFMSETVRRGSLSFSWFVVASAACVYQTGLLLVCSCHTSAASVEPLPRGSRAVAFPRWLHVLSCSTWLIVRCSLLYQLLCFGLEKCCGSESSSRTTR